MNCTKLLLTALLLAVSGSALWTVPAQSAAAAKPAPVEIRDVRIWAGPESTRVVLDLSGPATHTLFTLKNPERVVVDVAAATMKAELPAKGEGLLQRIRSGDRPDGSVRLVLEVTNNVPANSFVAPPNDVYGHRLVIDLGNGARDAQQAPQQPTVVTHVPTGTRDLVIAIDAGHGGEDPGAIGRHGTREKDVALAIARKLAARIDAEPGMRAVLTRNGDYFLPLRTRMKKAREQKADLFISVHADAVRDRSVTGSSVYILSPRGASDEASRWLAERENAADLVGGVSLTDKDDVLASVLLDLSQVASLTASMSAAEQVLRQLGRVGTVHKQTIQQAGFVVLKSPDVPSMLVETAYISNPTEEKRLKDSKHQERLADAILGGVRAYFYDNPPPGTRLAALVAAQAR